MEKIVKSISSILCFCLLIISHTIAQEFYASVDAKQILLGSYVEVVFTLKGKGDQFKPPNFTDFDVIRGPSTSNSMSIVNGVVDQSMSYTYILSPKRLGKLKIDAASVISNGKLLKSKALTIEVLKGSAKPSMDANEAVFFRTILSDSISYVGDQLTLEYKLYATLDVKSIDFINIDNFDAFFTQSLELRGERTKREIVDGKEYYTKVVKRIALYPQQTGSYEIVPANVTLGIDDGTSQRGFFFSRNLKPMRVQAPGASVIISPTPQNPPPSFSGAIGNYKMNCSIRKRSLTTDEAITVYMTIEGDGDSKTVQAPQWVSTDSLEVYDPNLIDESISTVNRKVITHKNVYEYLIVPKFPGRYSLNPAFSYYAPDSQKYVTLTKKLPQINVIKGTQSTRVQAEEVSFNPIITDANWIKSDIKKLSNFIFLLMPLLTILIALILWIIHRKKINSGHFNPIEIKRTNALEEANKRLLNVKTLKDKGETKAYFTALSQALKQFLQDKYNIPALYSSNEKILSALSNKLSAQEISKINQILSDCEIGMYAPSTQLDLDKSYNLIHALFANVQ